MVEINYKFKRMPKKSIYEGWGYSDTIKLLIKGVEANRNLFYNELKSTFPKEDISKVGKDSIEVFVDEKQVPVVKKMATIFKMKIAYKGGGRTENETIANTILQQLGGYGRLIVMTGAYNFVIITNGVGFKIKNRKVNYIQIVLNGNDLYDVTFTKIFSGKAKKVSEFNDVYFDQLIPLFEKETGMYLKLFKKGGFVSSQNRDMVLSQLKSIHHHEEELRHSIKTSKEVEAWVLAKVQRATTDLSDVTHYIDGKTEYAKGGKVKVGDLVYPETLQGKWKVVKLLEKRDNTGKTFMGDVYYDTIIENEEGKRITYPSNRYKTGGVTKDDQMLNELLFKTGGKTPEFVDLFEDYENIPDNVQKILDKYSDSFEDGDYEGLTKAHNELDKIGYTFEFYLDGEAYALRPKNVTLNQVKGFEEYAKGGIIEEIETKYQLAGSDKNGVYTYSKRVAEEIALKYGGDVQEDGSKWYVRLGNQYGKGGISFSDANPYIAGAKTIKSIAPESVSALDKKMASRINPDPNRPVFFATGGSIEEEVSYIERRIKNLKNLVAVSNEDEKAGLLNSIKSLEKEKQNLLIS